MCTTVPSWMDVRAPIVIGASSARITAPAHTDDPAPERELTDEHRVGVHVGVGVDVRHQITEGVDRHPSRRYRRTRCLLTATAAPGRRSASRSRRERHGDVAVDDYAWLRDRDDPDLQALLEAENAHADAVLAPQEALRERIYEEIKARTQETDLSVPYRRGGWWYYSRTVEGLSYPIHCRMPDDGSGPPDIEAGTAADPREQVLLDENAGRRGSRLSRASASSRSAPTAHRLAWSVDHDGDEAHVLHVRDLATGEDLDEAIPNTSYGFAWAADSRTFFPTTLDAMQRPWRVLRHVVGDGPARRIRRRARAPGGRRALLRRRVAQPLGRPGGDRPRLEHHLRGAPDRRARPDRTGPRRRAAPAGRRVLGRPPRRRPLRAGQRRRAELRAVEGADGRPRPRRTGSR